MSTFVELRQPLLRIETDTELPKRVDVVVVGGGIIGISTAYFLARKGYSVLVLEKGLVGAEQSSRNWGWCRQLGRDLDELPLMKRSIELWNQLQCDDGLDLGFRTCGSLLIASENSQLSRWRTWQRAAHERGVETQLLTREEALRKAPGYAGICAGGIFAASDGYAEPERAAPILAQAARKIGVKIIQGCAVRLLDIQAGCVTGVLTERGAVSAHTVVCAAGAWSGLLLRRHGINLPQGQVHGSAVATFRAHCENVACVSTPTVSTRIRNDGGLTVGLNGRGTVYLTPALLRYGLRFLPLYRVRRKWLRVRISPRFFHDLTRRRWGPNDISPFEQQRILDPQPDRFVIDAALRELPKAFPDLEPSLQKFAWSGVIDSMPDLLPVISSVDTLPGLIVSTGYSGHGFGIAPAAGELLSALVSGDEPIVDVRPFSYHRLVDGSKLRPAEVM